jgi:archaellum component FlaG (FlaF/FlaG flagellin family)
LRTAAVLIASVAISDLVVVFVVVILIIILTVSTLSTQIVILLRHVDPRREQG